MQTIHTYIHFPENLDENLDGRNAENAKNLYKDFQMTIDLADCENGSLIYYCKSNKDKFFDNIHAFEELNHLNIGSYDLETFINSIFNENSVFAVGEEFNSNCKIMTYNSEHGGIDEEIPFIFFNIIHRNKGLMEVDKQIVLNLFNSYFSQNPILFIVDCTNSNDLVSTIEIPYVTNFHELDTWLIENRLKRNFNCDDNRHIENHPQSKIASHNKSPLIGGLGGKKNAENLLENAIGDKKSISNKLDLMNFDYSKNAYIWYEFENVNNQYHAYHLVKAFTHEKDNVAVNRISNRVLKLLEYRERMGQ